MYYTDDTVIFLDGQFVKARDAKTDLYGQTLHYGFGVFEGVRSYRTVNGTKIFKAAEHFERLKKSCELVGIPLRHSVNELIQISYHILEKNKLANAYIRPLVFCSPNMSLSAPKEVSLMIAAWEMGLFLGDKLLRVMTSSFQRPNPKGFRIEAKASGHYVNSILASQEAKAKGYDEALLTDMNGYVAEGPGANVFFEKNGKLVTPPTGNILPGITRATVIEICAEMNIPVEERLFTTDELKQADAAFFCGTAAEVIGWQSFDEVTFPANWNDTIGKKIQTAYKNRVTEGELVKEK